MKYSKEIIQIEKSFKKKLWLSSYFSSSNAKKIIDEELDYDALWKYSKIFLEEEENESQYNWWDLTRFYWSDTWMNDI